MTIVGLIAISGLVGYWVALKELESPKFQELSFSDQVLTYATGIGFSVLIAISLLIWMDAI